MSKLNSRKSPLNTKLLHLYFPPSKRWIASPSLNCPVWRCLYGLLSLLHMTWPIHQVILLLLPWEFIQNPSISYILHYNMQVQVTAILSMNYFNSFLTGHPTSALAPPQSVLNRTARVIPLKHKTDNVLLLSQSLQWCPHFIHRGNQGPGIL